MLEVSVWPKGLAGQGFVPWLADILLFPWWLLLSLLLLLLKSLRKLSAPHTWLNWLLNPELLRWPILAFLAGLVPVHLFSDLLFEWLSPCTLR